MTACRQLWGRCRKVFSITPLRTGSVAVCLMMILAVCVGSAEETFLESEGEIFTVVNGRAGTHCTGKVVAISESRIDIMDKEANRKSFAIDKGTRICNRRNEPIPTKDFTVGELVTIATADDDKGHATGIRKGPILIRLTNMQPVPIGK